METIIFDIAHR